VGVGEYAWNGPKGDGFYVGFVAAGGGTAWIYMGYFPTGGFPAGGPNNLQSVRTTDSSPGAPSVDEVDVLFRGNGANSLIYGGVYDGTSNLNSTAYSDNQTLGTPVVDDCETAYTSSTDHLIYYDMHPYFYC
jgi:hypothetical protein